MDFAVDASVFFCAAAQAVVDASDFSASAKADETSSSFDADLLQLFLRPVQHRPLFSA
jgi:hypothetical protein